MCDKKHENPHVVVGLGASGLAAVRYLKRQGLPVAVVDSSDAPSCLARCQQEFPEVQVYTGGLFPELLLQAKTIVLSPGVPLSLPELVLARQSGVPIQGEIECFAQSANAPVVAITGSNGKSTTTTLVGLMCEQDGRHIAVGGNLGTPALDLLQEPAPFAYILELSSFQLETTYTLAPVVAAVLNCYDNHLDRYPSREAYWDTKHRIFREAVTCVINRADPHTTKALSLGTLTPTTVVSFGLDAPSEKETGLQMIQGRVWLCVQGHPVIPQDECTLKGTHQIENLLAAMAIVAPLGISIKAMREVASTFTGIAHRCQVVGTMHGVTWINDSKATNIAAAKAVLQGLTVMNTPLIVIMGGQSKGEDFNNLSALPWDNVKQIITMGETGDEIAEILSSRVPVLRLSTLEEAVNEARALAEEGDAVVLLPACTSYDQYTSFVARGEHFVSLVTKGWGVCA